jgi:uncharacterized protein
MNKTIDEIMKDYKFTVNEQLGTSENVGSGISKVFVVEPAPDETNTTKNEEISSSDRNYAFISHLSGLIFFLFGMEFVIPLFILFTKGNDSKFVLQHSWQAFLFQLIMLIVKSLLIISFIGWILIPFVFIFEVVLIVRASLAAHRGKLYNYPFLSRLNSFYEI